MIKKVLLRNGGNFQNGDRQFLTFSTEFNEFFNQNYKIFFLHQDGENFQNGDRHAIISH
jgi:hypothetical protein